VHGVRFDDLTRLLASHTARRQILKTAVWGAVAVLAGALRPDSTQAAAGFSTLPSAVCWQQNQVSIAGQYCPYNATCNSGTPVCPPAIVLWNGDNISVSRSSDRAVNPGNGQPRHNALSHAARLQYPARTGHVETLYRGSHLARATQTGPHSALAIRSGDPGAACLIGRRVREAGALLGRHTLLPRRTRGPPRGAVVADATASLL
jgi:hypothetical protein